MRRSKVVKDKISSAESFCSTSQFLTHSGSPAFVIAKAYTQRKTRPLLHKLTYHSVSFLHFACGAWPPTGKGVVRVSCIHSTKIKAKKIFSGDSEGIFAKILQPVKISCYSVCFLEYDHSSTAFMWAWHLLTLGAHVQRGL